MELARGRTAAARQEIDRAWAALPPGGFPFAQNARLQITRARVEAAEGDLPAARARLQTTADSCRGSHHVKREQEARTLLKRLLSWASVRPGLKPHADAAAELGGPLVAIERARGGR